MEIALVRGIPFRQAANGIWSTDGTAREAVVQALEDIAHALGFTDKYMYLDALRDHPDDIQARIAAL